MKKSLFVMFTMFFLFVFATSSNAGTLENQGRAWLDAQKDPALINVSGTWKSSAFGDLSLTQAAGSRDVSGDGGGYDLTGVVSGKSLYLVFSTKRHGTADYCAVVSAETDTVLSGEYFNRLSRLRFGAGLCQQHGRTLHMKKQ
ncbi:MAG TPA: hypothetical protein VGE85_06220 [Terracidiphilus sp.]|jgi:hypothetical protein